MGWAISTFCSQFSGKKCTFERIIRLAGEYFSSEKEKHWSRVSALRSTILLKLNLESDVVNKSSFSEQLIYDTDTAFV